MNRLQFTIILTTFVIFPLSGELSAQDTGNPQIDSLENVLRNNPPSGAALLKIYYDLSWIFTGYDLQKSIEYSQKGAKLAESLGQWYDAITFYYTTGISYVDVGNFDIALAYYDSAFQNMYRLPETTDEEIEQKDRLMSKIYGNLSNVYGMQGKDHKAAEYALKAKELFEKIDDITNLCLLCGNLGQLYIGMENYEQAYIHLKQGEEIAYQLNDSVLLFYIMDCLHQVHIHNREFQKALECAEMEYRIAITSSNTTSHEKMIAQLSLANAWLYLGNTVKAKEYSVMALKNAEALGKRYYITVSLSHLARVCLYEGKYAEALQLAERALQTDTTDTYFVSRLYNTLSAACYGVGDSRKAADYADRFEEMITHRTSKNYQAALSEMEVRYETEKNKLRIVTLEDEKRFILWLSIFGSATLVLGLAALFFLWRLTVQKRRLAENKLQQMEQERQLVATQAVLDGETQERSRLARDLHDGLGSMLTGVKLNLESMKNGVFLNPSDLKNFETALNILNESMLELRRVAHHLMPEALGRFGLKPALGDFCRSLSQIIVFNWFGESERLDRNLEIVIYRIVNELVNNALKYSGASQILVQVMQEDDRIAFTVQDDGCGFDPSNETAGMGLTNIRNRVASFDGIIQIDSSPDEGTEINAEFKIKKPSLGGITVPDIPATFVG